MTTEDFNKGIFLALGTSFISGLAVFLNKFAVAFWKNSSVFTTSKNLLVAIFLIAVLVFFKKYSEIKTLSKKDWLYLAVIGFIGGSIPFLLFFKALSLIPASNAAFIHKTLFIWIALMAIPFLKEKLSIWQLLSLILLAVSVFLIGPPARWQFGYGETLALLATLFWAVENIIAKIALKRLSSILVSWGRMFFGSGFLILYLISQGQLNQILPSSLNQASWLIISSLLLFGYVITWYSALKLAPATVVSAILVIAAPITILLNSIFVTKTLPANALFASFLMILGLIFVSKLFEVILKPLRKSLNPSFQSLK